MIYELDDSTHIPYLASVNNVVDEKSGEVKEEEKINIEEKEDSYIATPDVMRAVYLTMWSAGSQKKMDYISGLLDKTELNSVVIDVKGSGGEMVFDYIPNLREKIDEFHKKGVYTIARIVVFQDSGFAKIHPEFSVHNANGGVWRDNKGFAWTDPASLEGWEYNISIAKKAIDAGFNEINYDYIRFPTDGKLKNIVYPVWDEKKEAKHEAIKRFSAYSKEELKKYNSNVKLSLDIFGYTFLAGDDLGIGQRLEDVVDNFDYIYPMTYPSHYSAGNFGYANPADYPYEVVSQTLTKGLGRLGDKKEIATKQVRPWIQVFDLGAEYTPNMIRAQIRAAYDVLGKENTGWLMWSPSNNYDEVLQIEL